MTAGSTGQPSHGIPTGRLGQKNKLAVQGAIEALTQELGRSPTVVEIAGAASLTQEEIFDTFDLVNYGRPISLEAEYQSDGGGVSCLADYLGAVDPEFDSLTDRIDLKNSLRQLNEREATIIYLKFHAGLSQSEIGKRLGVSQIHVSRLQRNALGKLRQGLTGSNGSGKSPGWRERSLGSSP